MYWIGNSERYIINDMADKQRQSMTEILREAFHADGRSIYQMGRDADIPYPALYRFIKGDKTGRKWSLNLITVEKLAEALGLELRPRKKA